MADIDIRGAVRAIAISVYIYTQNIFFNSIEFICIYNLYYITR